MTVACHDHRVDESALGAVGLPSRRRLLRFVAFTGGTGALLLTAGSSGCALRVEPDTVPVPLLPTAEPHPAQALLLDELAAVRGALTAIGRAGARPPGGLAAQLGKIHTEQERVLLARLAQLGTTPPANPLGAPHTEGAARGHRPATPPLLTAIRAAEANGVSASARAALADVPPSDRALIASLRVQRSVAWLQLGPTAQGGSHAPLREDVQGPDGSPILPPPTWRPSPALAIGLAPPAAAARYGTQVVAARAADSQAAMARAGATALSAHATLLADTAREAGHPAVPQRGYRLPFPVNTTNDVARLARHVWTAWSQALSAALTPVADASARPVDQQPDAALTALGAPDASALAGWLIEAELMRQLWQAPAVAFPGLYWTPTA